MKPRRERFISSLRPRVRFGQMNPPLSFLESFWAICEWKLLHKCGFSVRGTPLEVEL